MNAYVVGVGHVRPHRNLKRRKAKQIRSIGVVVVVAGHNPRVLKAPSAPIPECISFVPVAQQGNIAGKKQVLSRRLKRARQHEVPIGRYLQMQIGSVLQPHDKAPLFRSKQHTREAVVPQLCRLLLLLLAASGRCFGQSLTKEQAPYRYARKSPELKFFSNRP